MSYSPRGGVYLARPEEVAEPVESYTCRVSTTWTNDLIGRGRADATLEALNFSAPPERGGSAGLWSPESLLLLAAGSGFMTTLLVLARQEGVALSTYCAEAEGRLERIPGQGYRFIEIVLRPTVGITKEQDTERALALLEKAERFCIVANALGVKLRVQPRIEVLAPVLSG